ncbi:MAG: FAD-dependent thymidylate synthase [Clostridia bacterium]|jgi:thymidylate synthase ThyX
MKKKVLASTKIGYELPIEQAIEFSGLEAGMCYMPENVDTLLAEDKEKTLKRANGTMVSGHHSVFGHVKYNFVFEEIPKILAMVLNNEKVYDTSEKSARYTKMKASEEEKALYEKWIEIYSNEINKIYPAVKKDGKTEEQIEKEIKSRNIAIKKKAQENARYLISVFTPATTMGHTIDIRQFSYILHWMDTFCQNAENTKFNKLLKPVFEEFEEMCKQYKIEKINTDVKQRTLSLFANREREEEWGENYSTNYLASFAEVAQAQRHRTIYYEITLLEEPQYYVPLIIKGTKLEEEWLKDILSLADRFPQGMLVKVNERGTVENFILKCKERLCGEAQLEIELQTNETLQKYLNNTKENKPAIYNYLLPYSKGVRCTFPEFKCTKPCMWGAKNALDRIY